MTTAQWVIPAWGVLNLWVGMAIGRWLAGRKKRNAS